MPSAPVRTGLSTETRHVLDAVRAAAALYVVAHHLSAAWPQPLALVFSFGQEAVTAFFLLSGFVIFASEVARDTTAVAYYGRRVRRIYPALLGAMVVSVVVAVLWGRGGDFSWTELGANLLGLQNRSADLPGALAGPFLGNLPLWSLAFELFFYLVFPPLLAVWRRSPLVAAHLVGAGSALAVVGYEVAPNHLFLLAGYAVVWWVGAAAAALTIGLDGARAALLTLVAWLVVTIALLASFVATSGVVVLGAYPTLHLRHLGSALVLVVLGELTARLRTRWWTNLGRAQVAAVAGVSYELYVLHFPVLVQTGAYRDVATAVVAGVVLVGLCVGLNRLQARLLAPPRGGAGLTSRGSPRRPRPASSGRTAW